MTFRLKPHKRIDKDVRRVLHGQIDDTTRDLCAANRPVHDLVHDTRTSCKKARAILRLIRPGVNDEWYHRENRYFRDAARPLTHLRDAEVGIKTLKKLQRTGISKTTWLKAQALLENNRLKISGQMLQHDLAPQQTMQKMNTARSHLKTLEVKGKGRATIMAGLQETYRRGRQAFIKASDAASAENLHEWRKQAKYLYYQLLLLASAGHGLKALRERFHTLTDLLGDDHDLVMLEHKLTAIVDGALLKNIQHRRNKLQKKAFALGGQLYTLKPRQFARKMQKKMA